MKDKVWYPITYGHGTLYPFEINESGVVRNGHRKDVCTPVSRIEAAALWNKLGARSESAGVTADDLVEGFQEQAICNSAGQVTEVCTVPALPPKVHWLYKSVPKTVPANGPTHTAKTVVSVSPPTLVPLVGNIDEDWYMLCQSDDTNPNRFRTLFHGPSVAHFVLKF